jgi:hypothetical protein
VLVGNAFDHLNSREIDSIFNGIYQERLYKAVGARSAAATGRKSRTFEGNGNGAMPCLCGGNELPYHT